MTLVEGGAFIMGKSDEDIAQLNNASARTVTVPSFYMDETEITNVVSIGSSYTGLKILLQWLC